LDVLQASIGVDSIGEEQSRGQKGSNEGTNTLYGLSEIQSDLTVLERPTNGEEAMK
jgi:hypothetical protein